MRSFGAKVTLALVNWAGIAALASQDAGATDPFVDNLRKLQAMIDDPTTMEFEFHAFANAHGKPYVTVSVEQATVTSPAPGQEDVYDNRFEAFKGNAHRALALSQEADGQTAFSVSGPFADMTPETFAKDMLSGLNLLDEAQIDAIEDWKEPEESKKFLNADVTSGSRDWRSEGAITPVKNQGHCGSCWAFSTVETIESRVRQQYKDESFIGSEQQLVSCDHKGDQGCKGGLPLNAYKYLEGVALEPESAYPYTSGRAGKSGTCTADKSEGKYKVTSFKTISAEGFRKKPNENTLKKFLLTQGPASIAVDATHWQLYSHGIMTPTQCKAKQLDHAVQLVAIDQSSSAWTVRNSWGTTWGEKGFIRLSTDHNTCLVANMATTADVEHAEGNDAEKQEGTASSEEKPATADMEGVAFEEVDPDTSSFGWEPDVINV